MTNTDQHTLLQAHYGTLQAFWENVLERTGYSAIVLSAGSQQFHFHDDQGPAFRPNPLMVQWIAKQHIGENAWLLFRQGTIPTLLFHQPDDFWHAPTQAPMHLQQHMDIRVFSGLEALTTNLEQLLTQHLGSQSKVAQISERDAPVTDRCELNPPNVIHALHFQRACKTEHELSLMRQASIQAARGHRAAQAAFAGGASEFGVHLAFLEASGMNEWQLPYGNIVAQNQHASLLHYQFQDREPAEKMNSMLIDAGANVDGYASDITRTYVGPNCYSAEAASLFADLLARMQDHQNNLISQVAPGANYVELQAAMHRSLANILVDAKLLECSVDEAITVS